MAHDASERRREVGRRVAAWRQRRGLTRRAFGDLCGRSVSWVDKVESGERALLRLPMLERVAEVLHIPVETLTESQSLPQPESHCLDSFEVAEIRHALQRYQAISSLLRPAVQAEPPTLSQVERQVTYAWLSFQGARYAVLGQVIPRLLRDAQHVAAYWSSLDDNGIRARTLLSRAYQVTASTLWKMKEIDLAWLAAERGLVVAERTGDTLLIGDAARRVAQGLMTTDQSDQSLDLLNADINRLEPALKLNAASAEYLSLYGMLFLMGSVVAARVGRTTTARELLAEGETVAARLGEDRNERYTAFGPTNVLLHRVSTLVEVGDGGAAVEVAGRVSPDGLARLPPERRANFLIDCARGWFQAGDHRQAVTALLKAESLAADEVRCRPIAIFLIDELRRAQPTKPSWSLQQLLSRVGLSSV